MHVFVRSATKVSVIHLERFIDVETRRGLFIYDATRKLQKDYRLETREILTLIYALSFISGQVLVQIKSS